nr:MAG TPA: hypothetical protein [Caudoviricetes sp.]
MAPSISDNIFNNVRKPLFGFRAILNLQYIK